MTGDDAQRAIQLLRQHRSIRGLHLDARETVNQVVRTGGPGRLVFKERRVLPEHVLLVDRNTQQDHMRGVGDIIERRLHQANALVERYEFRRDPRVLKQWLTSDDIWKTLTLRELSAQCGGHRMFMISEGVGLVDSRTGRPKLPREEFDPWPQRAILTPKSHANWDEGERGLERFGFFVAEANSENLLRMAEWFVTQVEYDEA